MTTPSGSETSPVFHNRDMAQALSAGDRLDFPEFRVHPLIRGGNAQTIFPCYLAGKVAPYTAIRHEVLLEDGDRIVLHDDCPKEWNAGDPVVLLMHGLTGCHESHYMRRIALKLTERGWRSIRMDHRGSGSGIDLARHPHHAALTCDGIRAIDWISKLCLGSPISAIGFSLSGNLLLKIGAERADELPESLVGMMAICPAIDVYEAAHNLRCPTKRRYNQFFTKELWSFANQFESIHKNFPKLLNRKRPKTLYEFDNLVTAPVCGYDTADEYYRVASSIDHLHRIDLPTYIVASDDDPLIPVGMFERARYSPSTHLTITPSGGHLGFLARKGEDPDRRWMDWRVLDWVEHNLAVQENAKRDTLPLRRAA